jgi:hypothetical protein
LNPLYGRYNVVELVRRKSSKKSMSRVRNYLAVSLVVAALCTDRVVVAAPTAPPVAQMASRLIHRLSGSFSRVMPAASVCQSRLPERSVQNSTREIAADWAQPCQIAFSPFEFRLPPPSL